MAEPKELRQAIPTIEIEIPIPAEVMLVAPEAAAGGTGESLSLETSLAANTDASTDNSAMSIDIFGIFDIMGSAVAESTGWTPPEALEDDS